MDAYTSLIVNNAYTRKAYDNGANAAKAGKDEQTAYDKWEERNWMNAKFDGDAEDAWHAGFADNS